MAMKIVYRARQFIGRHSCIDSEETVCIRNAWEDGGLIYGYKDRFNVVAISKESILSMEEV